MAVDFSGQWEMFEQSDPEEFLRAVSAPDMVVKMIREVKPMTTITQSGEDFVVAVKTPLRTNTNSFTIGKETDFCAMNGTKCKGTAQLVDGKLIIETERFTHVREMHGEHMVETLKAGSAVLVRRSKKV
ncbi:fatty acid-binding protein, liver [Brachyhypopomus gauderio]|uniref:fatty acid-binding protein, liver n=1 Tax=Brachyhypopomus gauderio TaxID=698409 RepID=UPI004042805E